MSVERGLLAWEFPDTDPDWTTGCWYDGQGVCTIHAHADNDFPEPPDNPTHVGNCPAWNGEACECGADWDPPDADPWVDRRDHYDR